MFHRLPSAQDSVLGRSYRLSFPEDFNALPSLSTTAFHAALQDLELSRQASAVDQELIQFLTDRLATCTSQLQCLQEGLSGMTRHHTQGTRGIVVDHKWSPRKLQLLMLPAASAAHKQRLVSLFQQRECMQSEALSRSELQQLKMAENLQQLHEERACEQKAACKQASEAAALRRQVLSLKAENKELQQHAQQLGLARLVQELQITEIQGSLADAQAQVDGVAAHEAQLLELQQEAKARQQQQAEQERELAQLRQQLSSMQAEQAWKDKVAHNNISQWSSSVLQQAPAKKSLLSMKLAQHVQPRLNTSAPDTVGATLHCAEESPPFRSHLHPRPGKPLLSGLSTDPIDTAAAQGLDQPKWVSLTGISDDTSTRCSLDKMRTLTLNGPQRI